MKIETKFEKDKWYKGETNNFYFKFSHIQHNELHYTERIFNYTYLVINGEIANTEFETFALNNPVNLSEIQQYLPHGHTDLKVKPNNIKIVSDYVKLIKPFYTLEIGKIFKTDTTGYPEGCYRILFEDGGGQTTKDKEDCFEHSTKEAYKVQFKPSHSDMEEFLEEAKRRYPIGTEYLDVDFKTKYKVEYQTFSIFKDTIQGEWNKGILYNKGSWAEIVSKKEQTVAELLDEANLRYPIGTAFYPCHVVLNTSQYVIITEDSEFVKRGNRIISTINNINYSTITNSKYGNTKLDRVVWHAGIWSEICTTPPGDLIVNTTVGTTKNEIDLYEGVFDTVTDFVIGKWYKIKAFRKSDYFVKYNTDWHNCEYIVPDTSYCKIGSFKEVTEITLIKDLSIIQNYIPDGHPDKIIKTIKPWSKETYVVITDHYHSVNIGDVHKIDEDSFCDTFVSISRSVGHGCMPFKTGVKWFETKHEAEKFAKTLTESVKSAIIGAEATKCVLLPKSERYIKTIEFFNQLREPERSEAIAMYDEDFSNRVPVTLNESLLFGFNLAQEQKFEDIRISISNNTYFKEPVQTKEVIKSSELKDFPTEGITDINAVIVDFIKQKHPRCTHQKQSYQNYIAWNSSGYYYVIDATKSSRTYYTNKQLEHFVTFKGTVTDVITNWSKLYDSQSKGRLDRSKPVVPVAGITNGDLIPVDSLYKPELTLIYNFDTDTNKEDTIRLIKEKFTIPKYIPLEYSPEIESYI